MMVSGTGHHLPPVSVPALLLLASLWLYRHYHDSSRVDVGDGAGIASTTVPAVCIAETALLSDDDLMTFRLLIWIVVIATVALTSVSWSMSSFLFDDVTRGAFNVGNRLPPFLPEEEGEAQVGGEGDVQRKKEEGSAADRRSAIMDQLVLGLEQARQEQQQQGNETRQMSSEVTGLTALITGASRGIGRAIAVELARYHPHVAKLILVARTQSKLLQLASDLRRCYGIQCHVVAIDLCKPNSGELLYKTIKNATEIQHVDILINNAGFAVQGPASVDLPFNDVIDMVRLNCETSTTLAHLFGRDMKLHSSKRCCRILFVSSLCGEAAAGIASVAVYSATKAYVTSLALALGRELKPYGVGVTCLIPGAVRDTNFKNERKNNRNSHKESVTSSISNALCWHVPYYPWTPQQIASLGVRALLRGDVQVTPGILNQAFMMIRPLLPQRLHSMVAEIMWNPMPSWVFQFVARQTKTPASQAAAELAPGEQREALTAAAVSAAAATAGTTSETTPAVPSSSLPPPPPPPVILPLATLD